MSYKVTAPLVIIANDDGKSGDWYGYVDALVPEGWNDDRCKQLVKENMLEKVSTSQVSSDAATFDPEKGGNVKDTLAFVGDDKDRATQLLALENAKGDDARGSLVQKLQAILDAG